MPYAKPSLQAKNELLKIINNDKIRLEAALRDRICEKQSVPQSTIISVGDWAIQRLNLHMLS